MNGMLHALADGQSSLGRVRTSLHRLHQVGCHWRIGLLLLVSCNGTETATKLVTAGWHAVTAPCQAAPYGCLLS